jgi:hypothetical protein
MKLDSSKKLVNLDLVLKVLKASGNEGVSLRASRKLNLEQKT